MENINTYNKFNEVFIKTKIEYKMFKNYFHQEKNEYAIHNSYNFMNDKYLISGFGILNLLFEYKIKFTEFCNIQTNEEYVLLKLTKEGEVELNEILEFNLSNKNSDNKATISSILKLNLEYIVIIKSLLNFYEKYSSYFSDVDNYFPMTESINKMACSCFLILSNPISKAIKIIQGNEKLNYANIIKNISLGEEIFTLSSSLGMISYPHFSWSLSKGIVSNKITPDLYLMDIRVLPNSHGALVFNKEKIPLAIIMPVLNVKYSYTPLIYSYSLLSLNKILRNIFTNQFTYENNLNSKLLINDLQIKINDTESKIRDSVFIIYNEKHYATCFYLGKGYFITNKHFFTNYELDDEDVYVKNYKYTILCKKYFIPGNNMDLAIVKIQNLKNEYEREILEIKIMQERVQLLQPIYCVSFSYFDRREIINELKYPNVFKGSVTKIIQYGKNKFDFVYGVDCACFSGGSGGPLVDVNGELIGVLFQNLTFRTDEYFLQVPNSGFIISKNIVNEIVKNIDDIVKLKSLWIFNIPNSEVDIYLNFNKFIPKF